jgi:hypothetical protein
MSPETFTRLGLNTGLLRGSCSWDEPCRDCHAEKYGEGISHDGIIEEKTLTWD